jgi:hypothetical protein
MDSEKNQLKCTKFAKNMKTKEVKLIQDLDGYFFEDLDNLVKFAKPKDVKLSESFSADFLSNTTFPNDWITGEGGFRWKGRSSSTGRVNYVNINWGSSIATCFLAEFTNLNNSYWAEPGYSLRLYKSNVAVVTIFIQCAFVEDEDTGSEPTVKDRSVSRIFADDIDKIEMWRTVKWRY